VHVVRQWWIADPLRLIWDGLAAATVRNATGEEGWLSRANLMIDKVTGG
jgi:hypothetical protein